MGPNLLTIQDLLKDSTSSIEQELCEFCNEPLTYNSVRLGELEIKSSFPNSCTCAEGIAKYESDKAEQEAIYHEETEREESRRKAQRMERLFKMSGMGERSRQQTLDTFETTTDYAKRMYNGAKEYTTNFENLLPKRGRALPKRNGIMFIGQMGTGKTHIASAISNRLIEKEHRVICMTERALLGNIRHTFSDPIASERDVIDRYINAKLLVVDDFGKEKATEWTLATIYAIIDGRYESVNPTIITTNYAPSELIHRLTPKGADTTTAECIVDRLKEMCHITVIEGESWRSK
ncbi:MAG: ATP-binding protein [Oscillospiraceae bacterium]|nr:ATP-binding protein [Oscillospiraceae bacterium]MCL2278126.1 ATP-binding protein [Oscillospiraceae bacterium]